MKASVKKVIYDPQCVNALNEFACQVHYDTFGERLKNDSSSNSVPQQIARQMEPVNAFMNTFQHMPILGAILFKTT
jgi:hypothetical protein